MGLYKIDSSGEVVSKDKNIEKKVEVDSKKMEQKKKFQNVNIFAKQVLEKMKKDEVLPSPSNYLNYFEKMLVEKSPAQKASIEDVLSLENTKEIEKEYMHKLDIYLNESFEKTKQLLEDINTSHTKINKIKTFIKTKGNELSKNPTSTNINAFDAKVSQALTSLENEQNKVKSEYLELAEIIKNFNKESIFDKKYGVYNKKYLFETIQNELKNLKNFEYKNSIIAFTVSNDVLKSIKLKSDKDIVIKTVAKIILDRSRRSDILAHYENGVFILLLKHTDEKDAQKALNSIKNFVSFSNFIIDSTPIQARIDTSILEMKANMSVDEVIRDAIKGLIK